MSSSLRTVSSLRARHADPHGVFAGIVSIAIVGYGVVKLMSLLRRRVLLWHAEAVMPSTV